MVVAVVASAASLRAERTLFSDNFNSPDADPGKGGVSASTGEAGRQSGTLAPLAYKGKTKGNAGPAHQVSIVGGQVVSGKGVNGRCSPDHDFLTDFAGTGVVAELVFGFKFTTPQEGKASEGSYAFCTLGDEPGQMADNTTGFGVLLSGKGKSQAFFAGSSEEFTYTPAEDGLNTAAIHFTAAADGSSHTLTLTINETKVQSYTLGKGGFGSVLEKLYLTVGIEFMATGAFDDLSVVAPTLPPK